MYLTTALHPNILLAVTIALCNTSASYFIPPLCSNLAHKNNVIFIKSCMCPLTSEQNAAFACLADKQAGTVSGRAKHLVGMYEH